MCLDLGGRHGELRFGPAVTHDVEDRVDPAVVMGRFPKFYILEEEVWRRPTALPPPSPPLKTHDKSIKEVKQRRVVNV